MGRRYQRTTGSSPTKSPNPNVDVDIEYTGNNIKIQKAKKKEGNDPMDLQLWGDLQKLILDYLRKYIFKMASSEWNIVGSEVLASA